MQRAAFTLVELSIVLVIIGLIVGGVLVGQSLIHAAEMRSQVNQLRQYDTAYATFRLKYNCIPGDCAYTTTYWPDLTPGNGNGFIENNEFTYYDASYSITWENSHEHRNYFIELSRAGYITFQSDGSAVVGKGLPELRYKSTGSFYASDTQSFTASRNPDIAHLRRGNNALWFTACHLSSGTQLQSWDDDCGIFVPLDLKDLDTKMDDGVPLTGTFFGFGGHMSNNNCLNVANTDYDGTRTTRECLAAYIID